MMDILDQNDATLDGQCACGCGATLTGRHGGVWFASEPCQQTWHARQHKPAPRRRARRPSPRPATDTPPWERDPGAYYAAVQRELEGAFIGTVDRLQVPRGGIQFPIPAGGWADLGPARDVVAHPADGSPPRRVGSGQVHIAPVAAGEPHETTWQLLQRTLRSAFADLAAACRAMLDVLRRAARPLLDLAEQWRRAIQARRTRNTGPAHRPQPHQRPAALHQPPPPIRRRRTQLRQPQRR